MPCVVSEGESCQSPFLEEMVIAPHEHHIAPPPKLLANRGMGRPEGLKVLRCTELNLQVLSGTPQSEGQRAHTEPILPPHRAAAAFVRELLSKESKESTCSVSRQRRSGSSKDSSATQCSSPNEATPTSSRPTSPADSSSGVLPPLRPGQSRSRNRRPLRLSGSLSPASSRFGTHSPMRSESNFSDVRTGSHSPVGDDQSLRRRIRALTHEATIWSPESWCALRQDVVRMAHSPAARQAGVELLEAVAASTIEALKTNHYKLDKNSSVDLAQYRRGCPAVKWVGGKNASAPPEVDGGDGFGPPIIFSNIDSLEALTAVAQHHGGSRHPLVVHLEASEFADDGQLHFKLPVGRQDVQRNLALRSDLPNFTADGSVLMRCGSKATVQDHLTAHPDPYVLLSSGVTLFRGGMKEGYPFMQRPVTFDVVTSARSYPFLKSAEGPDKSQWYAVEVDNASLLDRLDLIALAALERLTDGPASALKAIQEKHTDAQPLLILSFDREHYPVDALAAALKHWRKRYSSQFYGVVVACGNDKEFAASLDAKVNFDIHDMKPSQELSSWHWDGELLDLAAQPHALTNVALLFRFGASAPGRRHSTGGLNSSPRRMSQGRRMSGCGVLGDALKDMQQAFKNVSPPQSPESQSRKGYAVYETEKDFVLVAGRPHRRNSEPGSSASPRVSPSNGQSARRPSVDVMAENADNWRQQMKIRDATRQRLRRKSCDKTGSEEAGVPAPTDCHSPNGLAGLAEVCEALKEKEKKEADAKAGEEMLRHEVGQLADQFVQKRQERRDQKQVGCFSKRASSSLSPGRNSLDRRSSNAYSVSGNDINIDI